MAEARILIVGAGPTGLAMALWLTRLGVPLRIVEKNAGPGRSSRAMVVQARTLEFYRQLDIADDVVNSGIPIERLRLWRNGRVAAALNFGDFGKGLSPYPFILSYPQDEHERMLAEHLGAAGVEIEWNTELRRFAERGDEVTAVLRKQGGDESCSFSFICGCDGGRSAVREGLRLQFPGGVYQQRFFVADVSAAGNTVNGDANFSLGASEFCVAFPIRSSGMLRLIGIVPPEMAQRDDLTFDDLRAHFENLLSLSVSDVNWFSTYHVHHRVSEHFRSGRAFVAGDAGHLHSPAGGQGMNTGIGDAVNLAWKLAAVIKGSADPAILDSYETERIAFARSLVATTDRLFQLVVRRDLVGGLFRTVIAPHVLPLLLAFSSARRAQFRLVSQTRINYRNSELSQGVAGGVHGGDRLPWVGDGSGDNFAPLKSLDWQIHVYGEGGDAIRQGARDAGIAMHEFRWSERAQQLGIARDAAYLVRPDGHVALADPGQDPEELRSYLSRFKIASLS
jgi:2-polyprenyl-6-methoxyphenol hydroxylase-like FAD-dependent oxidoreductase